MANIPEILGEWMDNGIVYNGELNLVIGGAMRVCLATGRGVYQETIASPFQELTFDEVCEKLGITKPSEFTFYKRFNIFQDLEDYLFDAVLIGHPVFATQSALLIVGTLAAPQYFTPFRNGKVNQFHMMIGESNCGKSNYAKEIDNLLMLATFKNINMGEPPTPQALHKQLAERNFGIIMATESKLSLTASANDASNGVLQKLMNIWASGERIQAHMTKTKDSRVDSVDFPAASMLYQLTNRTFETALLNDDVTHGGFLPRCSWGYAEVGQPRSRRSKQASVPQAVIAKLRRLGQPLTDAIQANENQNNANQNGKEIWLQMTPDRTCLWGNSEKRFLDIQDEYNDKCNYWIRAGYYALASIYGRIPEKVLRHSCLAAIWAQEGPAKEVLEEDLDKALDFELTCLKKFQDLFRTYEKSNEHERVSESLMRLLEKNGGQALASYLRSNIYTKDKNMFDTILGQKEKDGDIVIIKQRPRMVYTRECWEKKNEA
jgi:hypothetical protein